MDRAPDAPNELVDAKTERNIMAREVARLEAEVKELVGDLAWACNFIIACNPQTNASKEAERLQRERGLLGEGE